VLTPDLDAIWTRVQAELRAAVTDSTYHIWLEPLSLAGRDGSTLLVAAPDPIRNWVSLRFGRVLGVCAAAVLGDDAAVRVVAPGEISRAQAGGARQPAGAQPDEGDDADSVFNPKYAFDQFVIGDTNRLAHGAALAVAELPGQAYNPLFIYGPPGVGKTHLLHSIGGYVEAHGAGLTVRYATAEAFTNEFLRALQAGGQAKIEAFKARYRRADVLLIDDVQFLERKAHTEAEFFHTFNALYESGSQLVLASDRLPSDLAALEERLRARFASGLVTDIAAPDFTTRLTILRMRAARDSLVIDDEAALSAIAERIDDNVRTLEGALIRVVAYHSLSERPITPALVHDVLDRLYPDRAAPRRTIEDIQRLTCEAFGISQEELVSTSRTARLTWPRQLAMYLARELTDETLPTIGRRFGDRNHSTVIHACRSTARRIADDPDAFRTVEDLTTRLREP